MPTKEWRHRFDPQEVLGHGDRVVARTRNDFWSLMNTVNCISATPPDYDAACRLLHLDPKDAKDCTGDGSYVKPYP